jgi:tRNA (adenine57-N1/adenine58-N1)-methyltransferase catalytic subunit
MSLSQWKRSIEAGHLVIVYEGIDRLTHVVAKVGGMFNNRYGSFHHDDIIGRPFGSRWEARVAQPSGRRRNGTQRRGFVYALHPTPELWTHALPHRTQIIYTPDISVISAQLGLAPGAVVIETGTGSGSLTSAMVRSVMPTGHVHTFEYHSERAQRARDDFKLLGIDEFVTVYLRNTMEHGFNAELDGKADAVFLDLPGPWEVVPAAFRALKEAGVLCSFSPCIEQVQRTCDRMQTEGFHTIRSMEVRFTNYESKTVCMPAPNFGYPQQPSSGVGGQATLQPLPSGRTLDGTAPIPVKFSPPLPSSTGVVEHTLLSHTEETEKGGGEGTNELPAAKRQKVSAAESTGDCSGNGKVTMSAAEETMAKRPASEKQLGYLQVV